MVNSLPEIYVNQQIQLANRVEIVTQIQNVFSGRSLVEGNDFENPTSAL